ncbi:MAG: hypothetical protein WA376_05425 [Terrimicrobiaceae bacterium]
MIDRNLWDSQPNVLINGICQNGRTELAACPVVGLVGESLPTATAYVSLKMIADNPPLDPAIEKFHAVNGFLVILMTKNGFGATVRTLLGTSALDGFVRTGSFRVPGFPQRFSQQRIRSHIDPFSLVIPVGSVVDCAEFGKEEGISLKNQGTFRFHALDFHRSIYTWTSNLRSSLGKLNNRLSGQFQRIAILDIVANQFLPIRGLSKQRPSFSPCY